MPGTSVGPEEEAGDWAAWLDRFEREIWPVFQRRGYTKEAAAIIYFTRLPENAVTLDEEDEEEDEEL